MRNSILHRKAVTAIDKLAAPGNPTLTGVTVTGGNLTAGTTYYVSVVAGNRWGSTTANAAVQSAAPGGSNNALKVAIAQVTGAEWYDVFLSADAQPKHVTRITEDERAAGCVIVAEGTALVGDNNVAIATAIRTALGENAAVAGMFTIGGGGTYQVEKTTIEGTVSTAGNATVTVTASGMTNSPKAVVVAVALDDTAAQVAGKIRTALGADADVAAFFTVSGTGADVILTAKTKAANDATMNIAVANTTSAGITDDATSDNATAGSAPTNNVILTKKTKAANDTTLNIKIENGTCSGITTLSASTNTTAGVAPVAQKETITCAGAVTKAGKASITVTAANMTNSPKAITYDVVVGDGPTEIAYKTVWACLQDADVSGFFNISSAADKLVFEAKTAAANDDTMAIVVDNAAEDGSEGITQATSANTTAGVAGTLQVETGAVTGTITKAGTAKVTITAAGLAGSPLVVYAPVGTTAGAANSVTLGAVGTGLAVNSTMFTKNNAYNAGVAVDGAVDCANMKYAHVMAKLSLTSLKTAPDLTLTPFYKVKGTTGDYVQGDPMVFDLLGDTAQSLIQELLLEVDQAAELKVLVENIAGTGASLDLYVELSN